MRFILVFILLFLSGCTSHFPDSAKKPGTKKWAPPPINYELPAAEDGSLFHPGYMFTLFKDKRAYRTGDILTVSLDEKTYSSKQANTRTSKSNDAGLGITAALENSDLSVSGKAKINRGFNGTGSSTQQNQLSGSITVTVSKVLPNGVLVIRGEKWLHLSQGDEYLRLLGLIRTDDIDNTNTISSQRIADARIIYGGQGVIADSNAMGWAAQYFNSPWFPL